MEKWACCSSGRRCDFVDIFRSEHVTQERIDATDSASIVFTIVNGLHAVKLPTEADVRMILAEDVRDEQGGKLSVIGMLPGDIKIETPGPNAVLASLAILWQVLAGEGKFKVRMRLADPNGRELLDSKDIEIEKKPDGYANLIAKISPFPASIYGEFKCTIELEGSTFTRAFRIVPR